MITVNKIWNSAAEAVADIRDGAVLAAQAFGIIGTPHHLFRALAESGKKDLTLICTTFIPIPVESELPGPVSLLPQLKRVITSGVGSRALGGTAVDFLEDQVKSGKLEIELTMLGTLLMRLYAAAFELGGFYDPVGAGTIIEEGKEKRNIDGREYVLEKPLRPDVGLIKAHRADKMGNLSYDKAARGANPIIAMAAKLAIVEVDEIVEEGQIDPEMVVTPGVYVDRIVKKPEGSVGSAKHMEDLVRGALQNEILRRVVLGPARKEAGSEGAIE